MSNPDVECPPGARRCTGCGQPTATSLWDGADENIPLCPECLGTFQERPEARELLLARWTAHDGDGARPA